MVLALIGDHFLQDCDTGLVTELTELLPILRDVSTFVDLHSSERKVSAADSVHPRIGLHRCLASIDGFLAAESSNAPGPKISMVFLGRSKTPQCIAPLRISLLLRQGLVRKMAVQLRFPVTFESSKQF